MKARNAMLWLVTIAMGAAIAPTSIAQEEPDKTKELQAQIDLLTKQLELNKLKYGTPLEGKAGAITGAEHLSGIAQQRALALSGAAARDLGHAIAANARAQKCPAVLLTDDANHATKQILAVTLDQRLRILENRLDGLKKQVTAEKISEPRSAVLTAAAVQGLANTVVGVWKLFQSDYTIGSFESKSDPDWIAANIQKALAIVPACPNGAPNCQPPPQLTIFSTRFPSLGQAEALTGRLTDIVQSATEVKNAVDTKTKDSKKPDDLTLKADAASLLEELTAMRTTLLGADASGVAPIASITPYLENQRVKGCTARWSDSAPSGIAVTRDTIFGKGGKVYLNTSAQLFAILLNTDGAPLTTVCSQRSMTTTVKAAELATAKPKPQAASWNGTEALSGPSDCAPEWDEVQPLAVQPAQDEVQPPTVQSAQPAT